MALKLNKNWLILLAALAVGGFAAFGAKNYISNRVADIEAQGKNKETVKVVVAKENLEKGAKLTSANVAVREVPKEWAHSGAVTPEQFSRVEGSTLAYSASEGESVIWAQLEGQRPATFSTKLTSGRRAVTVPVDEISSLSGMVEPDDLIDIIVSVQKDSKNYTFTLLQSVRVLATGKKISQSAKDSEGRAVTFTTITLDASPEDAKRLIAAREIGRVTALLRSPTDTSTVSTSRTSADDILGLGKTAVPITYGLSSVPVIYGGGPIKEGLHMNPKVTPQQLDVLAELKDSVKDAQ